MNLIVTFFLKGEGRKYALKQWQAVPRVGDEVMLGPDGEKFPTRVIRVVWGVEGPDDRKQAVNIEVERVEEDD